MPILLLVSYSLVSLNIVPSKTETDVIFELSNKLKILRHDVDCKRQANLVLEKTIEHLKTKNADYAQHLGHLSSTVDTLVECKKETLQRMSMLEDDLSAKNITIDKMSSDIQLKSATLDERAAEILDLTEQFRLAKAEHNGLEIAIQELVVSNQQYFHRVSGLEDELATKMSIIEEMSADVSMWNSTCEEKTNENSALKEQLDLSKAEVNELKAAIEGLTANHRENMQQLNVLEEDMSSKINLIDEMITELNRLNSSCDALKVENIHLVDQVKFFMNECDQFKTIVNDLETSNSDYASELEQLTSSNDELLNTVKEFTKSVNAERLRHEKEINEFKMNETDTVSRMTDLFNTEKSNLERELDQVKNMLESEKDEKSAVVKKLEELKCAKEQMTSHTIALNETLEASIADIDEAMLEIQSKNLLLEEKIAENDTLAMQLKIAQVKSGGLEAQIASMTGHLETLRTDYESKFASKSIESNESSDLKTMDIHSKDALLEEKIADNAYLTQQLDLAQAKSDRLEFEIVSLNLQLEIINKTVCAIVADETLDELRMFNEENGTEFLHSVESLTKTVIKSETNNDNMIDEFVAIASVASSLKLNEGITMKAMSILKEVPCQNEDGVETNMDEIEEETEDDIVVQSNEDQSDAIGRVEQDGVDDDKYKFEVDQLVESSVENITTGGNEAGEYVDEYVEESTEVSQAFTGQNEEAAKVEAARNEASKLSAAFASAVKTAPVEKEVEASVAAPMSEPTSPASAIVDEALAPPPKAESPSTKTKLWQLFPGWGAGKESIAQTVDNPVYDTVSQSVEEDVEKKEGEKFSLQPTELLEDSSKENITTRLNKDGENSSNKTVSEIATKEIPSALNNNVSNVGRLRLLFENKGK